MGGGGYGAGGMTLPRVIQLGIARFHRELPAPGEPLDFLVSIHEEGTGITWQQNVTVPPAEEAHFLSESAMLYWHGFTRNRPHEAPALRQSLLTAQEAAYAENAAPDLLEGQAVALGTRMRDAFLGPEGVRILRGIQPTAFLLDIDETILNLPWELMTSHGGVMAQDQPLGRLVRTRMQPAPGRDPIKEDRVLKILAIANPTSDLHQAELEVQSLASLEGYSGGIFPEIRVTTLYGAEATRKRFVETICGQDFDFIHFAGHGAFDTQHPDKSALFFADEMLSADDVLHLPWTKPPYLVFNAACESARIGRGQRLVSPDAQPSGLAAAFLAAGTMAYAGYTWPVSDQGARLFSETFYHMLLERENVGLAILDARQCTQRMLAASGDLTCYSAVLFGDAASRHRRDLATAD